MAVLLVGGAQRRKFIKLLLTKLSGVNMNTKTKVLGKTMEDATADIKSALRITVSEAVNTGQFGHKKTGGWI